MWKLVVPILPTTHGIRNRFEISRKKPIITAFTPKGPDKYHRQSAFFKNPFATGLVDSTTTATRTPDHWSPSKTTVFEDLTKEKIPKVPREDSWNPTVSAH